MRTVLIICCIGWVVDFAGRSLECSLLLYGSDLGRLENRMGFAIVGLVQCTSPIIANRPIGEHFSNLGFSGSSGRFWYLANVGLRRSDFVRGICGGMGKCQFSVSLIVGFSIVFYYLRLVSGWAITALAYFRVSRMPAGRQVSGIIFGYLYRTPGRDVFHHTMLLPVIKFSCMKV